MASGEDEGVGRSTADFTSGFHDAVEFEGVRAGDPDEAGASPADPGGGGRGEAKVGRDGIVPRRPEGGPYVFQSQGFDSKEWCQSEAIIARVRPEQKNLHDALFVPPFGCWPAFLATEMRV
jgi:hypothetical protein